MALRAQPGPVYLTERSLHTVAGEVKLEVPRLWCQTFETAIIERRLSREMDRQR
jgi:transposase-like protein